MLSKSVSVMEKLAFTLLMSLTVHKYLALETMSPTLNSLPAMKPVTGDVTVQ